MQRVGKVGGSSRSDTDGFDPSLWTPIRLAGSRIARNLEKQTNYQSNVFAEGRKSRSDTDGLDPCLWTATPLAAGPMARPTTLSGRRKALCIYIRSCCGLKRNIFATSTISRPKETGAETAGRNWQLTERYSQWSFTAVKEGLAWDRVWPSTAIIANFTNTIDIILWMEQDNTIAMFYL